MMMKARWLSNKNAFLDVDGGNPFSVPTPRMWPHDRSVPDGWEEVEFTTGITCEGFFDDVQEDIEANMDWFASDASGSVQLPDGFRIVKIQALTNPDQLLLEGWFHGKWTGLRVDARFFPWA